MVNQKCTDCNGTGKDGYHKEEGCITCHGTGELEVSESKKIKEKSK
jgi:DnaJ-class molecular chaperone